MKILIFSDSHLSSKFEEKKLLFLKRIISEADLVVINGDFWEGFVMTFDEFINSQWKELFPLLKAKKAVYLYGNHDKESFSDERRNQFSEIQGYRHELQIGTKTFIIEHGNRLFPTPDEKNASRENRKRISTFINAMEKHVLKIFGKKYLALILRKSNSIIKKKLIKELGPNQIFICGHTHSAEFNEDGTFINSGFIKHGLAQYITIVDGKVSFKEEFYN